MWRPGTQVDTDWGCIVLGLLSHCILLLLVRIHSSVVFGHPQHENRSGYSQNYWLNIGQTQGTVNLQTGSQKQGDTDCK